MQFGGCKHVGDCHVRKLMAGVLFQANDCVHLICIPAITSCDYVQLGEWGGDSRKHLAPRISEGVTQSIVACFLGILHDSCPKSESLRHTIVTKTSQLSL